MGATRSRQHRPVCRVHSLRGFLLTTGFLILAAGSAGAQDRVGYIRIGGSQFTGVAGIEVQVGHIGIEAGWAGFTHRNFDKAWHMAGIGVSGYTRKPMENSFYATLGYAFNGVLRIALDDAGIAGYESGNSAALMVGYKWGGSGLISVKGGTGYQLSPVKNSFTCELSLGIGLLAF